MKFDAQLDELDKKILDLLLVNSREKNTVIARKLDITEGAVRKRIKRLEESNVIEAFTIKLSDNMAGFRVIVQVKIGGNVGPTQIKQHIIADSELASGVEDIFEVTGDVDLFVVLHMTSESSIKEAIEKIRSFDGVAKTTSYFVLTKNNLSTVSI